jgi:flagellin-like protein
MFYAGKLIFPVRILRSMRRVHLPSDERSVSSVIAIILLVAVTVILAAVISTFVLGLGEDVSNTSPIADFEFEFDDTTDTLTIIHAEGDKLDEANLKIVGGDATIIDPDFTGDGDSDDSFGAGIRFQYSASPTDTVRVTWNSDDGERSASLGKWDGLQADSGGGTATPTSTPTPTPTSTPSPTATVVSVDASSASSTGDVVVELTNVVPDADGLAITAEDEDGVEAVKNGVTSDGVYTLSFSSSDISSGEEITVIVTEDPGGGQLAGGPCYVNAGNSKTC